MQPVDLLKVIGEADRRRSIHDKGQMLNVERRPAKGGVTPTDAEFQVR